MRSRTALGEEVVLCRGCRISEKKVHLADVKSGRARTKMRDRWHWDQTGNDNEESCLYPGGWRAVTELRTMKMLMVELKGGT